MPYRNQFVRLQWCMLWFGWCVLWFGKTDITISYLALYSWQQHQYAILFPKIKCTLVQALRLCTGRTARRGSRGITLLFHDHGTSRGWGVSVTPQPLFTPGKDPVPIVQEAGWVPGPVWTGAENLAPSGFDPRTVQPVASRYTDYATRPTRYCSHGSINKRNIYPQFSVRSLSCFVDCPSGLMMGPSNTLLSTTHCLAFLQQA